VTDGDAFLAQLRADLGASGAPHVGRHPITSTAIADWCDAIGDENPCYTDEAYAGRSIHAGLVAPPATLDIWDRPGLPASQPGGRAGTDPRSKVIALLEQSGFTSVVAVNSELELQRYLLPGEVLQNVQILEDVSPEKQTGLGTGHFVTTRHRYTTVDGEHVGDLLFRILKFKPGTARVSTPEQGAPPKPDSDPALRPRPAINRDNEFFWEGARAHELRIQRCTGCGALHFPPTPRCAECGAFTYDWVVSSGRGHLYSYAVPHYPQANGFDYPVLVGLVELEEGTRLVSNIIGCRREHLQVGMPLELEWLDSHPAQVEGASDSRGAVSLPQFRPATPTRNEATVHAADVEGKRLPIWSLPVTPTLVVSGALATRDFTPVHHDRDLAIRQGSTDIFLNINTTLGLMARYVTDWAGPEARVTALRVRLGASAYPNDPLTFEGAVQAVDGNAVTVGVRAANSLGDHASGTVELVLP
jgi:uncharacterized OB-fold protein/acyl dehydratase